MKPALTVQQVHVTIGGHAVLRDLNLQLLPGQIRAMVGLNGAGKTTALRVALGMLRPDKGKVLIEGREIWPVRPEAWTRVGHLVETPSAYPELTARENITHAVLLHGADPCSCLRRAERLGAALGMSDHLDTKVRRLSLGTRQKVGLICALAHEPAVAVLDEPTNALDPLAVLGFRDELRRLADQGSSILLTSHHFDELARVADEVDILHCGHIIDTITPDGHDLERTFFDTVVAADRASKETS